jgi:IS30 family transposase
VGHGIKTSYRTVYEYIYNSNDKKQPVIQLCHHSNKYRRLRDIAVRTKNNRNKLLSIHERAELIEIRTTLGDYKADTIFGLDKKIDLYLTWTGLVHYKVSAKLRSLKNFSKNNGNSQSRRTASAHYYL